MSCWCLYRSKFSRRMTVAGLQHVSVCIFFLLLVASCSGGTGDDADSVAVGGTDAGASQEETASSHFSGFIGIEESGMSAIASFSVASRAPTVFEMEEESCLPFATDIVSFTSAADTMSVAAGESVILDDAGGTYATLPLVGSDSDYPYYQESDLPADTGVAISSLLTLTTTGDGDFPASFVNIPDIEALTLVETTVSPLISGIFQWVPSAMVEDDIVIRISYIDSITSGFNSFTCRATDDGIFELPEVVVAAANGAIDSGGIYRQRVNIIFEQNISWFARRTNGIYLSR